MRKVLYILALWLVIPLAVHAQENRGSLIDAKIIKSSVMIGGGGSGAFKRITEQYYGGKYSSNQLQLDLDVKAGYFFFNDLAAGLKLQGTYERNYIPDQPRYTDGYILGGPFVRYYLDEGLFTEGSVMYGKAHTTYRERRNLTDYRAGVGYSFFINPKVAVEPAIMFSYFQDRVPRSDSKTTEFGPFLSIGIQVFLFQERNFYFF